MTALPGSGGSGGKPSISVVIPTHNNAALLVECLNGVERLDYPADQVEVVIVNNASTDRTREIVSLRFPSARVIALESNTGFAEACNRGARAATGKYVGFLNNDAIPEQQWLNAMLAALDMGSPGTVCAASRIVSRDGSEVEYDGAGSNLFGAGRPHSTWGWPEFPEPPEVGSPVLFASGGAMLIERAAFIDAGGFDSEYFAYFEDVDLGWRLWIMGLAVVYAPDAVVRHIGGATGRRAGAHRRYTLWESNSLATVIKNYESGQMEKTLSAALMLEYKRALLAAGDALNPSEYVLSSAKDTNRSNVERLPKVSVAHLAAIDRLNAMLPHLMRERARIQALRRRPDSEILPLMGRLYAPQFAGEEYADAATKLAEAVGLFEMTDPAVPPRVLLLTDQETSDEAFEVANTISPAVAVAVAHIDGSPRRSSGLYTVHAAAQGSDTLRALVSGADVMLATGNSWRLEEVRTAAVPVALVASREGTAPLPRLDPARPGDIISFCQSRALSVPVAAEE